jgi:excisionase family DNA binding protein
MSSLETVSEPLHAEVSPQAAKPPPFLSTAEAAKMLGLSTTMVQSLMDSNELKGWKTRGGHRRISLHSIQAYQRATQLEQVSAHRRLPQVMVVSEDPERLRQLKRQHRSWDIALPTRFFDSVTEALLEMTEHRPDMLLVELMVPLAQQNKTLQALHNFTSRGAAPLSVVLLTQEKSLQPAQEKLGKSAIQVVSGPLTAIWLQAYLTGIMATHRQP